MRMLLCDRAPRKGRWRWIRAGGALALLAGTIHAANPPTAENSFSVKLSPPLFPGALLPDSPFGINTAFDPDSPDLDARLQAMLEPPKRTYNRRTEKEASGNHLTASGQRRLSRALKARWQNNRQQMIRAIQAGRR